MVWSFREGSCFYVWPLEKSFSLLLDCGVVWSVLDCAGPPLWGQFSPFFWMMLEARKKNRDSSKKGGVLMASLSLVPLRNPQVYERQVPFWICLKWKWTIKHVQLSVHTYVAQWISWFITEKKTLSVMYFYRHKGLLIPSSTTCIHFLFCFLASRKDNRPIFNTG